MAKFTMQPTVTNDLEAYTVRLGAGTGAGNNVSSKEVGKFVKLVGESRFDLCAIGDAIEGAIVAVETATQDGYSIGSIVDEGTRNVTFEGSQAAGTGAIAVGDYVVAGTPVAKGTALGSPTAPNVRKATAQPFAVPADLTAAAAASKNATFGWRVVSLGSVGTGAVGTTGVIQRVNS